MSFINTQLNDQIVLFLTIQLMVRHLFAFCLIVKQFYFKQIGPNLTLPFQAILDLERITLMEYSAFPKVPLLEIRDQMV